MLLAISFARAIIEMLGLCLLGQGVLYFLAGEGRIRNPVYQLFATITAPLLARFRYFFPRLTGAASGVLVFLGLFCLWIGLAVLRKSL